MGLDFIRTRVVLLAALGGLALPAGADGGADSSASDSPDFRDAVQAIKAGRHADAIPLLERYTLQMNRDADGFNWLGYAYRHTGKLDRAFVSYKRALALDPTHRGAHEYIGEAYVLGGQRSEAEKHLKALADLCKASCEEYKDLKQAIDTGRVRVREQRQ